MKKFQLQKIGWSFVLAVTLAGIPWNGIWGEEAKTPPSKYPDFETYKILVERNAFDATRNSKAKRDAQANASAPPPPRQTLRLLGTWIDSENASALFEGDGTTPREGVKRGGTIAGYTVEDIRTDAVVLRKDQETLELRVGSGLEKGENDKWTMVEVFPEKKEDPTPIKGGWAPKLSDDDKPKTDSDTKPDKDSADNSRKRSKRKEKNS